MCFFVNFEACNFIKKETLAQAFFCEFCEIFKSTFLYRTPLVTASGYQLQAHLRFVASILGKLSVLDVSETITLFMPECGLLVKLWVEERKTADGNDGQKDA